MWRHFSKWNQLFAFVLECGNLLTTNPGTAFLPKKHTLSSLSVSHTHVPYPHSTAAASNTHFSRTQHTQQKNGLFSKKRISYTVSIQKDKKLYRFNGLYRLHPEAVQLYNWPLLQHWLLKRVGNMHLTTTTIAILSLLLFLRQTQYENSIFLSINPKLIHDNTKLDSP